MYTVEPLYNGFLEKQPLISTTANSMEQNDLPQSKIANL